jgi:ElaB/YqjD/DUF883 family membrane-anchored ribosome-binding protein
MNATLHKDRLVEDLQTITRDAEALVAATAGEVSEKVKESRRRLTAAVETAKETCENLKAKAVAGVKATDRVIRDHPYETIGIAFGVGLVAGLLVNRARS